MVPSVASVKSPATPLGIDPETLQLVAQCLNHYATQAPIYTKYPQILGAAIGDPFSTTIWRLEFLHLTVGTLRRHKICSNAAFRL
jgi:hypothetical protein